MPATADSYIARLRDAISQCRILPPGFTESAEWAAGEFLAGGNLWAAGRQPDFIAEACTRAGGLMSIAPLGDQVPAGHDVILYSATDPLDDHDRKNFDDWRTKGATPIPFCPPAALFRNKFPIDTVINVAKLWAWTGEFVAACTRMGKMPTLYKSYGLPGGYERAKKYEGKKFHDDLSIQPIAAGVLAKEYLDQIERILARIQQTETPKIVRAAEWWARAKTAETLVTGHMFPFHAEDPRTVHICDFIRVPAREDKSLLSANPPEFVLYLGYQFAPQKLLDEAKLSGVKLVYTDVQPGQPAEPANNILYIDPTWPLADGCVTVPGYDIPILPASGVIQAAIYWAIASEAKP